MDLLRSVIGEKSAYDERLGQLFVFGYDEVKAGLDDKRLTADRMHAFAERAPEGAVEGVRRHAPWTISSEGADYAWIRPLVLEGIRGRAGDETTRAVAGAADTLLDDLLPGGRFDAARDYARELAGWMLADFFGVDRRDGTRLIRWALDIGEFFGDVRITVAGAERMARAAGASAVYVHEQIARPDLRDGFLATVAAAAAEQGRTLDVEGAGQLVAPFLAGQTIVGYLIANAIWILLSHDADRTRVKADPELLAGAIGETMRYAAPISLVPRIATEAVVVGGQEVRRGATIQLSVAAANRDPARFPDPDRFDIDRAQGGTLGFGHGAHSCIGAKLARRQAEVAVGVLLERAPRLELAGEVSWGGVPGVQAVASLPVRA
jgi:pimeloyl-[acyl-carrier protein] synthase